MPGSTSGAIAFHNGRFVPPHELALGFADAGFVSGAAVTDFCRTYRHELFRWPDHLARLRADCAAVRVPLPYSDTELTAAATQVAAHNARSLAPGDDLALVTFATPGPLAYMTGAAENGPPTIGMHTFPLPRERYRRFFTEGATLAVAGHAPTVGDGVPAGVKHRSRIHWWLADRAVADPTSRFHCPGAVPALVSPGGAADTPIGSVLVVAGDAVIRPIPGTALESVSVNVVRELCGPLGLTFRETGYDFARLCRPHDTGEEWPSTADVSEILLAGSGFGVAGVRRAVFGAAVRDYEWPGPVLRGLQAAWSELVGMDVERQWTGERGTSAP
ncbi:aminotransferase class IV [Fimbriiglobus ruber]|uniref:Branched-chain amino acid aminotransferase n=1 Tax=Fimbriiglobus ruber TaxID=1908690 RepID=A0A225DVQ7_9BACT|nr:aminotransferase class IV [Fimbriiglobus ruber]OWK43694.1 Branched-chain amino acid aminotransferase [Fimbriiglobus ruber]